MKLTFDDAVHCAKAFEDYFGNFNRIDEYMRDQKLNSLAELPSNPLYPLEDELFSDFTMHPKDMDFEVIEIDNETWTNLLNITSSHVNIPPVGRNVKLAVKETTTGKFVGFIRLGSPVINCKPRNEMLGQVFTQQKEWGTRFNNAAMMGFVIVPAQPFGFNYLGDKLLAAICSSHQVRYLLNSKYDMTTCLFETTSLYGSSKAVSQYDGMKPLIRFKGLTDSDFLPMLHGKTYTDLKEYMEDIIGEPLAPEGASSRKLKISNAMVSIIKTTLRGTPEGTKFAQTIENAKNLNEQKRYFISDYGFKNMVDFVNGKDTELVPGENYEKHNLTNLVEWWRKKAINRYESLKNEGRIRTEQEVWTGEKEIDIIR